VHSLRSVQYIPNYVQATTTHPRTILKVRNGRRPCLCLGSSICSLVVMGRIDETSLIVNSTWFAVATSFVVLQDE